MAYFSQEEKKAISPAINSVLKKYGVKGSLSVSHNMCICLNLRSGKLDLLKGENATYRQVNIFQIDKCYAGEEKAFLKECFQILNKGNHNNSDSQRDYFDVGWYVEINIGRWDKPYLLVA